MELVLMNVRCIKRSRILQNKTN